MTKRATKNLIAHWRVATAACASLLILPILTACSNVDVAAGTVPTGPKAHAEADTVRSSLVHQPTVAATGVDGYPNINVDTAHRLGGPVRSAADQDRLEAELLALGARQRAGGDGSAPTSVINELEDLGRRSRRDAESAIESGQPPSQ